MPTQLVSSLHRAVALAAVVGALVSVPAEAARGPLPSAAAIGAPQAWTVATGGDVVVAVIDSGVRFDHPALRDHLWTNPDEVAGNGVDDDRNGYVDDVHGLNAFDPARPPVDDVGHGTHVAGLVAGVAPAAQVMSIKTLDSAAHGNWNLVESAVHYALAEGADIINLSIVGTESSPALERAVAAASAAGVPIVAAAGNYGQDIDRRPVFPAGLPDPGVLGVGAIDDEGRLWSLSDHGPQSVELVAPGVGVTSPGLDSDGEDFTGTSASAPLVSGALALLASARPDLPSSAWTAALLGAARKRGLEGLVGAGAVDVVAALRALVPGAPSLEHVRVRIDSSRRPAAGRVTLRWRAQGRAAIARWRIRLDGCVIAQSLGRDADRVRVHVRPGGHRWSVVALNDAGASIATATARFRARRATWSSTTNRSTRPRMAGCTRSPAGSDAAM